MAIFAVVLIAWTIISVPVALLVGAMFGHAEPEVIRVRETTSTAAAA